MSMKMKMPPWHRLFETGAELSAGSGPLCRRGKYGGRTSSAYGRGYAENPDYWESIDAIRNGDVIYLPISYIATSGILVVDEIDALIDIIADHYATKD